MPFIKLESFDCVQFKIDAETAKFSGTIKNCLDECGLNNENDAIVPLPNVNSNILRLIVEWANHHRGDPPTIDDDENGEASKEGLSEWDSKFFERMDTGTLYELIAASDYLDAKELMAMACKTVGSMISGKTAVQIRKLLNITSDFTPALEQQDDDVDE